MKLASPTKVDILGVPISLTSYEQIEGLVQHPPRDRALTIAVCNVHSVMSARRDPQLHRSIVEADVATPDGQPLVWAIRALYEPRQERVYGPELMRRITAQSSLRHYLYGSTRDTLDSLEQSLRNRLGTVAIAGTHSPPFRTLSPDELAADAERIMRAEADVVWVGLGMPKQELWMHQMRTLLPGTVVIGVGAAFDMLSGRVRQAPAWVQRAGLEWLFRLAQEPRRLWRRYLWNNPSYAALISIDIARTRFGRSARRRLRS